MKKHFLLFATLILSGNLFAQAPPVAPSEAAAAPPPQIALKVVSVDPPEAKAKNSRVLLLSDPAQIPDDFWAQGEYGDTILQNDFVSMVFGAIPEKRDQNARLRPGSILDVFTDASVPENFQVFKPTIMGGNDSRLLYATAMDTTVDEKTGSATVTVLGEDTVTTETAVDTTYEMRKGWPGVLVTTTVTNESKVEKTIPAFADHIGLGAMTMFASGNGWVLRQGMVPDNEFCFARMYDSILYLQPVTGHFDYYSHEGYGVAIYQKDIKLAPGESKSYARWLLTGQKDPSKLYTFVLQQKGPDKFGYIAGQMVERNPLPNGKYLDTGVVPNAEVRVAVVRRADLSNTYLGKPYMYTFTDANGNYQIAVPEGEYLVTPFKSSRVYTPANTATRAGKPGTVAAVDLLISKPATIAYEITDADTGKLMPGKISFVPLRGTNDPDLGPPGSLESGNTVVSATGRGIIDAPIGKFRLVASHGTSYHSLEQRVEIAPMKSETVRFALKRAFKTDGWISADIGVLTNKSPQSRITAKDRVASALAEGLDWIVTADAGEPTDLQPTINEMNAAAQIRASQGFRLTSLQDRAVGEYLLFPLDACALGSAKPDFTKALSAKNPKDAIAALKAICPAAVLVAHRPIFPTIGLLAIEGYDVNSGTFQNEQNGPLGVDALQVWEGKRQPIVEQSIQAWMTLAERGEEVSPVAYSLSGGTFNEEVGYPRMYIRSSQSDPQKLDIEELSRNIKRGRVQITNGPFIDLKVNGASPDDIVTAKDRSVELEMKIFAPNWANVSGITINLNGKMSRRIMLPAGSVDVDNGQIYPHPSKSKPEDEVMKIPVEKDSIMTITVEGDPALPQDPVNPFFLPVLDPNAVRGQYSYALAQTVFIDADGDGLVKPEVQEVTAPTPTSAAPNF